MIPILRHPPNPFSVPRGAGSEGEVRLRISAAFAVSASVLLLAAILLPRDWSDTRPSTRSSPVTVLPYLDLIPLVNADGGGRGSSAGAPDPSSLRAFGNVVPVQSPPPDTARAAVSAAVTDGGNGLEGGMGYGTGSGTGAGTGDGGGPGIGLDIRPIPVWEVIPEYPERERKQGVRGLIELEVRVDAAGRVDSVRVAKNGTPNAALEKAAVRAARESRYLPVEINGKPVSCWFRRSYWFEGN
jgi:TonB family protein